MMSLIKVMSKTEAVILVDAEASDVPSESDEVGSVVPTVNCGSVTDSVDTKPR